MWKINEDGNAYSEDGKYLDVRNAFTVVESSFEYDGKSPMPKWARIKHCVFDTKREAFAYIRDLVAKRNEEAKET